MINPFGEDDDGMMFVKFTFISISIIDFELNRLIDRHIQVGFLICDPLVEKPDLLKDKFWNKSIPDPIPYTVAAEAFRKEEYKGSAEVHLKVKESERIYSDLSLYGKVIKKTNQKLQEQSFSDSTDDNYETIKKEGLKLKKFTKRIKAYTSDKKPPLPDKNVPLITVSKSDKNFCDQSSVQVTSSLLSFHYNEDDEEFEEISVPENEPQL